MKVVLRTPETFDVVLWHKIGDHPNVIQKQIHHKKREVKCNSCKQLHINHGTLHRDIFDQDVCPNSYIVTSNDEELIYVLNKFDFEKMFVEI